MKKATLILVLLLVVLFVKAQTKKVNVKKDTVKYEYFYKVPPDLFNFFMSNSHEYKDGLIYNGTLTPEEKVKGQILIDQNIAFIAKKIKIDSIAIKKDTTSGKK